MLFQSHSGWTLDTLLKICRWDVEAGRLNVICSLAAEVWPMTGWLFSLAIALSSPDSLEFSCN